MKVLEKIILAIEEWMASSDPTLWVPAEWESNVLSFSELEEIEEFLKGLKKDSDVTSKLLETFKSWKGKTLGDYDDVKDEVIKKFGSGDFMGKVMNQFNLIMKDKNASNRQIICAKIRDTFEALMDVEEDDYVFEDILNGCPIDNLKDIIGEDKTNVIAKAVYFLYDKTRYY